MEPFDCPDIENDYASEGLNLLPSTYVFCLTKIYHYHICNFLNICCFFVHILCNFYFYLFFIFHYLHLGPPRCSMTMSPQNVQLTCFIQVCESETTPQQFDINRKIMVPGGG